MKTTYHLLLIIILAVFSACNSSEKKEYNKHNEDIKAEYILWHTKEKIHNMDAVEVVFKKGLAEGVKNDSNLKALKWTPHVEGTFVWAGNKNLEFKPEKPFESNQSYRLTLDMKLLDPSFDGTNSIMTIEFEVLPIELSMQIDPLIAINDRAVVVKGRIHSNSKVNWEEVKNGISLEADGSEQLSWEWTLIDEFTIDFRIEGLERESSSRNVEVKWNGKKIDPNFHGSKVVSIWEKGLFQIEDIRVSSEQGRHITLYCSDVVDEKQDLNGLIRIDGYSKSMVFESKNNEIRIYVEGHLKSPFKLLVDRNIRSKYGESLSKDREELLSFEAQKPAVQSNRKGIIVPKMSNVIVPFSAKNLRYVDVEIFKVFNDNILQYLQYNNLNHNLNNHSVGRVVETIKVDLHKLNSESNESSWVDYGIDLSSYIERDPKALYQIMIGFRHGYASNLNCDKGFDENDKSTSLAEYGNDYRNYYYRNKSNPCERSYYMQDKYVVQNVFVSSFGMIVKGDEDQNSWQVYCTDLNNGSPRPRVKIESFDFQQQSISSLSTDLEGVVRFKKLERKPSFFVATIGDEIGYINVQSNYSNSMSDFNIGGIDNGKGIQGYIYGERSVWRPGDTIHLTFVAYDSEGKSMNGHFVNFLVKDARNKVIYDGRSQKAVNNFYTCSIPTSFSSPTGNWKAIVTLGNEKFYKALKVETIKPNRLKIEFPNLQEQYVIGKGNEELETSVSWLHGAKADRLKIETDVTYSEITTKFKDYKSYVFDDPARKTGFYPERIYDGKLDAEGSARIKLHVKNNVKPKGKLSAKIKTRVYEKSGNFSEDYRQTTISPYQSYVGVRMPKSKWGHTFIKSNTPTEVSCVVLDASGKIVPNRKLKVGLYSAEWNWWYDRSYNRMYEYNSGVHTGAKKKFDLTTDENGLASWKANIRERGTYLVRICDEVSGHCTGSLFYSNSWSGMDDGLESPKTIRLESNKEEFKEGEIASISIPSNEQSKILITIEKSGKVIKEEWLDGEKGITNFSFECTHDMTPNVYVNAMIIQPYVGKNNDLPFRLYGLLPIEVKSSKNELIPEIDMEDVIQPNSAYTVRIKESSNKEMTYTLAVVDEGLLSITNHQTPNPYQLFFGKQALNLKTWDVFDFLASPTPTGILNVLNIGGDGFTKIVGSVKANRFKPIVSFIGPFTLKKGKENKHVLKMENYVGEVRVMVVAGNNAAFGNASKSVKVKKDLMLQSTMPRVLAPGEEVIISTNVFAMASNVKHVDVDVETSELLRPKSTEIGKLEFKREGDQILDKRFEVGGSLSVANINISANSGRVKANEMIEIEIQNPNVHQTKTLEFQIAPGESSTYDFDLFGVDGSNTAMVDFYNIPNINLESRLSYLIRYPYGCLEQTTSKALAQLSLDDLLSLSDEDAKEISYNINEAIIKISNLQLEDGGFGYWPGSSGASSWGTSYAGELLVRAKSKGYYVSSEVLKKWLRYQKKKSASWRYSKEHYNQLDQAYRLYTLSLNGNADLGSMNRMRTYDLTSKTGRVLLGLAYAEIGEKDVAIALVDGGKDFHYETHGRSFGSYLRDQAFYLSYYSKMGQMKKAFDLCNEMSKTFRSNQYINTHALGYSLKSIAAFARSQNSGQVVVEMVHNGRDIGQVESSRAVAQKRLDSTLKNHNKLTIKNKGTKALIGQISWKGQPPLGQETNERSDYISVDVSYFDFITKLPLDISSLKQGQDFYAKVNVKHLNNVPYKFDNMALTYALPSGWEIRNQRLSGQGGIKESKYTYKDIKDASQNVFFNLSRNESKTYVVQLTAAYKGKYYHPLIHCGSMYDDQIVDAKKGFWVEVK